MEVRVRVRVRFVDKPKQAIYLTLIQSDQVSVRVFKLRKVSHYNQSM